jgi:hypothetical protein
MSEAPRLSESTSSTFVSLTTGDASADFARLPRSISSVRVAPERESGSAWYLRAVSAGMILMMAGSTSKWSRLIDGTPYRRDNRLVISSSFTKPRLTMAFPILPPQRFAWFSASWSCWGEVMFSLSSSSPSLMGILTLRQILDP